MDWEWSGKRNLLMSLVFVLFLIVGIGLYFYLIKPVQAEIEQVQQLQAQEELLIEKISAQLKEKSEHVQENTLVLQKKVPVSPLTDQFLLHLERAEEMTNTQIKSIKLEESTKAVLPIKPAVSEGEAAEDPASSNTEDLAMPAELKRISVTLEMLSPDYQSMENFLIALEQLPRVMLIDLLQFDAPVESDLGVQEEEIRYKLQVSIFHAEDLDELLDELPEEEFIKPANKKVPVSH